MIQIFFGSQSGNAQNLANVIGENLQNAGIENEVFDFADLDPSEILNISTCLIVTSTYGDGEPPDNASEWMSFIKFEEDLNLSHLKFAVVGLGDTYYPHFCQCGKDFEHYLSKRGAHALQPRLDCDLYFEEQYGEWLKSLIEVLKKEEKE